MITLYQNRSSIVVYPLGHIVRRKYRYLLNKFVSPDHRKGWRPM